LHDEVGARRSALQRDDPCQSQLLPRGASYNEILLEREVALRRRNVVRELPTSARKLQNLLVRLNDVQVRARHARRQTEEARLLVDVPRTSRLQIERLQRSQPAPRDRVWNALDPKWLAECRRVEGDWMKNGRVLEQQRQEVSRHEPAAEAIPRAELGLREPFGPSSCRFLASQRVKKCRRPRSRRPLFGGEASQIERRHQRSSSGASSLAPPARTQ